MKKIILSVMMGLAATVIVASAQNDRESVDPNPTYDGRYAFARLRYTERADDPCTCVVQASSGLAGWQHDYPHGDRNLMKIMTSVTSLNAPSDSSVVLTATDPDLMRYPILYLSEPACWRLSEADIISLRNYLLKGGFLIVDDFSICSGGAVRFERSKRMFIEQIRRVLPEGTLMPISLANPVVNTFFKLDTLAVQQALNHSAVEPTQLYGIYERNDPKRRLMVVANYNAVVHRFWDWKSRGLAPIEYANQAYKLGVNYIMYGFTH